MTRLMRSQGCQRRAPAAVDYCSRAPRDEGSTGCLLLSERLEGELLAANTGLEHEAPLTGGEDRHAFLVFGVCRRVLRSRHRACLSRERKRPLLEVRQRRLRLEEDDSRVGLT